MSDVATQRPRLQLELWLPAGLIALFVLIAVAAPLLAPYDPNAQNLLGWLKPPGTVARGFNYALGSDELGRDVVSRLIYVTCSAPPPGTTHSSLKSNAPSSPVMSTTGRSILAIPHPGIESAKSRMVI